MASQTLYRKWRSQTFGDIIGQQHVTRTLLNAMRDGLLSHAYLFCGPRGVGKTSIARLLAKAANCTDSRQGEPCNACENCRAITAGHSLDVIEIDAASNRGIDEIRDLREKVGFAPNDAKYKFYILDEAHMLTNEASNALLKTLEEPPAHVVFVLVTTEPHKLVATIQSRCQRFDFRRIPLKDIVARLAGICAQENIAVEESTLELVARLATGSLRDAVSLLDQLVAYCGHAITLSDARTVLGITGSAVARDLVDAIIRGDVAAAIRLINDTLADGADLRQFNREAIEYLRGILVTKVSGSQATIIDVAPEVAEQMSAHAALVQPEQVVKLIRIFAQADLGLRGPVPAQLPIELAVVEATLSLEEKPSQGPVVAAKSHELVVPAQGVKEAPLPLGSPPPTPGLRPLVPGPQPPLGRRFRVAAGDVAGQSTDQTIVPPVAQRAEPDVTAPGVTSSRPSLQLESAPGETAPASALRRVEAGVSQDDEAAQQGGSPDPRSPAPGPSGPIDLAQLMERWPAIIAAIGNADKKTQAILRDAEPGDVIGDRITLRFAHAFHKEAIEKNSSLALVEKTLSSLLGGRWRVQCAVGVEQKKDKSRVPTDDPLVREAIARGARVKTVHTDAQD